MAAGRGSWCRSPLPGIGKNPPWWWFGFKGPRQLSIFQGQCVIKQGMILLVYERVAWCEWERRNVDMWSASCHCHSEIPHKLGRILNQCQQILDLRLRTLLSFYTNSAHFIFINNHAVCLPPVATISTGLTVLANQWPHYSSS